MPLRRSGCQRCCLLVFDCVPSWLIWFCAATKVVNILVTKLPADGNQKEPSSEVVVNICGVLNNLVTSSYLAARDITFFDGLPKLVGIKESHDNRWVAAQLTGSPDGFQSCDELGRFFFFCFQLREG